MMEKKYQEPEMIIDLFKVEDVIATSNPMTNKGEGNWNNEQTTDRNGFFN